MTDVGPRPFGANSILQRRALLRQATAGLRLRGKAVINAQHSHKIAGALVAAVKRRKLAPAANQKHGTAATRTRAAPGTSLFQPTRSPSRISPCITNTNGGGRFAGSANHSRR